VGRRQCPRRRSLVGRMGVMSWPTSSGCPALHLADSLIVYVGGAGLWCARVVCSVLSCDAGLTSMYVVW